MPRHRISGAALTAAFLAALSIGSSRASAPVAAQTPTPASGAVLASDDFSNPSTSLFSSASPVAGEWTLSYLSGEFQVAGIDPSTTDATAVSTNTNFGDVIVTVDARVDGDSRNTNFGVVCRWSAGGTPSGYEVDVYPAGGGILMSRLDSGQPNILAQKSRFSAILSPDRVNHIELTCSGNTISARVNNTSVGSFQDSTYSQGAIGVAVGRTISAGTVSARFSHFVVTQP